MSDNIINDVTYDMTNIIKNTQNNISINNTIHATDFSLKKQKKIKKKKNKCNFFIIRDGKKIYCKERTDLIGNNCSCCSLRYCIKHTAPEAHNCVNISEYRKNKKCIQDKFTLAGKTVATKIESI